MTDLHDESTSALDESTLWATDSLLDALSVGEAVGDDRGLSLLAALVADVGADLPTTALLPAESDELGRRRTRLRRLAPRTGVALAAAVAVVSTGGVAAASVSAGPTSPLFPLHQVLTGQPQLDGSQRQALEVRDKLRSATRALAAGKVDRAQKDVSAAASRIAKVDVRDGRRDLAAQWTMLNKQVKARAVAPVVVPAKPTQTIAPTPAPTLSPSVTGKPTVTPSVSPTVPHTTTSPSPAAPAPVTTSPAPTSPAPTTTAPVPVAPTSAEPSGSVGISATPTGSGSPVPSDTPGKGGHKGTTTPSAAPGSPVDPIVITPEPSETVSPVPDGDTASPPPSNSPATDAPASSQPTASAAVVTTPPPASAQPSG